MKNSTKLFMASCCALISCNALASDGTVDIVGNVVSSSCSISVNGYGQNATITLPDVSVTSLASAGATAGSHNLDFILSECPPNIPMRVNFESYNVDSNTGYLTNNASDPAGNVEVQVLNKDNDVIDLRNNSKNFAYLDELTDDTGNVTLKFYTQYVAVDAAATPGTVNSQLVYTLQYP